MYTTFFDRPELAAREPERYAALTPEALSRFAADRLGPERGVEMTVVPRKRAA
jgi:hypothetical protein